MKWPTASPLNRGKVRHCEPMTRLMHHLRGLPRLFGRPSVKEKQLAEANAAHEKRIKALGASLAFLTNTLNSAADGVMAIHFASGAKYVNPGLN
ncbi:MAG: hypothetical protein H7228_00850 [Polaromonas sp.]|nr:hypothetical protein [Polaromonas sp.]